MFAKHVKRRCRFRGNGLIDLPRASSKGREADRRERRVCIRERIVLIRQRYRKLKFNSRVASRVTHRVGSYRLSRETRIHGTCILSGTGISVVRARGNAPLKAHRPTSLENSTFRVNSRFTRSILSPAA